VQDIQRILDLNGGVIFIGPLFSKLISFQNINAYFLDPYPHHANALVMFMA
jgi:hypothetical protein